MPRWISHKRADGGVFLNKGDYSGLDLSTRGVTGKVDDQEIGQLFIQFTLVL